MRKPTRKPVDRALKHALDVSGPASDFARSVFQCLYLDSTRFAEVHQCSGYWADGYVKTVQGENIPFEIKDTLGWSSMCTAFVQVVSIAHALPLQARQAWVIFEDYSASWHKKSVGAAKHAAYCASMFHSTLEIHLVQMGRDCTRSSFLAASAA